MRLDRSAEWAQPVPPVRREVLTATPEADEGRPPLLFVPGYGHGAWLFAEHWLEHAAGRGFAAHAVSLRGHGRSGAAPKADLRAYAHDVAQVAASLPRQAVLIGHGAGALVVAHALARYPARAAALVSPVFGGWETLGVALRRNPAGTIPALFGAPLRLSRKQLFSRELPDSQARQYASRVRSASRKATFQLITERAPEPPVGDPPVLVIGSREDRVVSPAALTRAARRYNSAPLLFPGMGHDLMLDTRWREPIDALLDWLDKELSE